MDRSLKTPRTPQRFSCTLEVAVTQENEHIDADESVIHIASPSGKNLLSLTIAHEIGQQLKSALNEVTPSINFDGSVGVVFDDEFQQANHATAVALDQLVADAVSPDMLEDEPDANKMLAEFRIRLIKSLELVEQAIVSLPKP